MPRSDWAVHVALWEDGELVAGAVARPAAGVTFATDEPAPAPGRSTRAHPPGCQPVPPARRS